MVSIWEAIVQLLFCKHEWAWSRNIQESNLRTGHKHVSAIYLCKHCGKCRTMEQP